MDADFTIGGIHTGTKNPRILSHGRMRHTDSRPSVYGNSMLCLSSFPPIKVRYFIAVFQAK